MEVLPINWSSNNETKAPSFTIEKTSSGLEASNVLQLSCASKVPLQIRITSPGFLGLTNGMTTDASCEAKFLGWRATLPQASVPASCGVVRVQSPADQRRLLSRIAIIPVSPAASNASVYHSEACKLPKNNFKLRFQALTIVTQGHS